MKKCNLIHIIPVVVWIAYGQEPLECDREDDEDAEADVDVGHGIEEPRERVRIQRPHVDLQRIINYVKLILRNREASSLYSCNTLSDLTKLDHKSFRVLLGGL